MDKKIDSGNPDKHVHDLALAHGLNLRGPLDVNDIGLDFRVVSASDDQGRSWILRMPRRPDMAEQISKEARILDLVRRHVPFEVPQWMIVSPELVAYPKLTDPTAIAIDPATHGVTWHIGEASAAYSASLGSAIAALHNIPEHAATGAGLDARTPMQSRLQLERDLDTVKAAFAVHPRLEGRWRAWIDDDRGWPPHTVVVHGDIYAGHVLVNEREEVTGIIDWSEARIDDPAIDFAAHLMLFGEAGLALALDHYERAGGVVWPGMAAHIAQRQAASAIRYALFALQTGDAAHLDAVRRQLAEESA